MKTIPIIIDADTGIDDALAIAVGYYSKNLDVKLITAVGGNTDVQDVVKNDLNLLSYINKTQVPVAVGSGKNYSKDSLHIGVHGSTGLGEFVFPKPKFKPIEDSAVEAMHKLITKFPNEISILCLGPLSNIMELIKLHPEDEPKIKELIISGGLIENLKENEDPYVSFNIADDSEASKFVLNLKTPITIVPSNLGHNAYLTWHEVYKTKNTNLTGEMFEKVFRSYGDRHVKNGIATHDLCAVIYVFQPKIFTTTPAKVFLTNFNNFSIMKFDFSSKETNAQVVTDCNISKIKKVYFKALKLMP